MRLLDSQLNATPKNNEENCHIAFIKSLLPTLNNFEDDERLEFQAGVISLVQQIKSKKRQAHQVVNENEYIPTPIISVPASPYSNTSTFSSLDFMEI